MNLLPRLLAISILASLSVPGAYAGDWPRWRGPNLDGISTETGWSTEWPDDGPRQLWKAKVGTGMSSVTVANGRAYTMGNRDGQESVYGFDAESGKELWKHTYEHPLDPKYYVGGPSATPTVDGDTVFALSRRGDLFALDTASGAVRWQKNLAEEIGAKLLEWGFASSPLVDGDRLILNVGTAGTAVDKKTGKVVWSTGPDMAGYATAVPMQHGGGKLFLIFSAKQLAAVNAADGKIAWSHPWETSYDVNAADPIVVGPGRVFISSGYGRGGALIEVKGGRPSVVWENKNMRNQMNAGVLVDGHLYGIDGNERGKDTTLRCLEAATGAVKWSFKDPAHGAVSAAGGHLIVLGEKGELMVGKISPAEFKPVARAQVLGGQCWTVPVLANGRLYLRNSAGDLVCVGLRPPQTAGVN
ncbi:MAG: PQQ-binding-like beta-propeller repeat protein [Limisphaerales bacterium]